MLIDFFGRRINYLRISLTDLCNFRCVYCVPPEGLSLLPASDHLTKDEIVRFVEIAGRLGITRVRLTGGEPLLRDDILEIVGGIKKIKVVQDLSITTNGSMLAPWLKPLKQAGLDRINISLDSLDPARFKQITLFDCCQEVLTVVGLALSEGFPIKLNIVAMKGLTSDEIIRFVRLAMEYPLEVRFLEFMPLCGSAWDVQKVIPIRQIRKVVSEHFNLEPEPHCVGQVAKTFKLSGGKGKVGFIGSLTESFCDDCSRMRLTADGKIRPCLFSEKEVSVREALRNNSPDQEIIKAIRLAVSIKPPGNLFRERPLGSSMNDSLDFAIQKNPLIRTIGG